MRSHFYVTRTIAHASTLEPHEKTSDTSESNPFRTSFFSDFIRSMNPDFCNRLDCVRLKKWTPIFNLKERQRCKRGKEKVTLPHVLRRVSKVVFLASY